MMADILPATATASSPAASTSPLSEVKYDSLDEFLSRDPFGYSSQDRVEVIRHLRAQRAAWEAQGSKGAVRPAAVPRARKVGDTTPVAEVSLGNLKI